MRSTLVESNSLMLKSYLWPGSDAGPCLFLSRCQCSALHRVSDPRTLKAVQVRIISLWVPIQSLGNPSRMAKLALAWLTFLAVLLPSLVCGQLAEVKATLETPAAFGDDAGKLKTIPSSVMKL
jgi:hypothetical protein